MHLQSVQRWKETQMRMQQQVFHHGSRQIEPSIQMQPDTLLPNLGKKILQILKYILKFLAPSKF